MEEREGGKIGIGRMEDWTSLYLPSFRLSTLPVFFLYDFCLQESGVGL